jgi:hypothetical protein
MKVAVSWSAGKDACLAWRRACDAGAIPSTFLTMCDDDGRSTSHHIPPGLVRAQADAAGVAWMPVTVPPGGYARAFDQALQALHASGHTHLVFGDIDLQAHRDWLEPACARAGLQAWFPLWGTPRDGAGAAGAGQRHPVAAGVRGHALAGRVVLRRRLRRRAAGAAARGRVPLWRGRRVPHLRLERAGLRAAAGHRAGAGRGACRRGRRWRSTELVYRTPVLA